MDFLFLNLPRLYVLPLLVICSIGLVFGSQLVRVFVVPVLLLYLALPMWEWLYTPLQSLSTSVVSAALSMLGIPLLIQGNFVTLPSGSFEIATGCSGLNYLIIGITLSSVVAVTLLPRWTERIILILSTILVTLLANWVRIFVIILAGHLTEMEHYLVRVDHITFGWVLYFIFLVPVVWIVSNLERRSGEAKTRPNVNPIREIDAPVVKQSLALSLALALSLLPSLGNGFGRQGSYEGGSYSWDAPELIAGFGRVETQSDAWYPRLHGAETRSESYQYRSTVIDVFWGIYPTQSHDKRLIRYRNSLEPDGWRLLAKSQRSTKVGDKQLVLWDLTLQRGGTQRAMWVWYSAGGRVATDVIHVKLNEFLGRLEGRRDAGAIALSTICRNDCKFEQEELATFLELAYAKLEWDEPLLR